MLVTQGRVGHKKTVASLPWAVIRGTFGANVETSRGQLHGGEKVARKLNPDQPDAIPDLLERLNA